MTHRTMSGISTTSYVSLHEIMNKSISFSRPNQTTFNEIYPLYIYVRIHINIIKKNLNIYACYSKRNKRKEGNVLFNDALNTFYLQLYVVGRNKSVNTMSITCFTH